MVEDDRLAAAVVVVPTAEAFPILARHEDDDARIRVRHQEADVDHHSRDPIHVVDDARTRQVPILVRIRGLAPPTHAPIRAPIHAVLDIRRVVDATRVPIHAPCPGRAPILAHNARIRLVEQLL